MSLPVAILTLALVAVVVLVISGPLRAASRGRGLAPRGADPSDGEQEKAAGAPASGSPRAAEPTAGWEQLEAAREAKYQEIRDTELDYRTGKLSREDYEAIDGELRAEAIEILNRLEPERG